MGEVKSNAHGAVPAELKSNFSFQTDIVADNISTKAKPTRAKANNY